MIKYSIVTITFNSERTITDTLESVLTQKYRPLEYIIVDGKSNDNTMSIIEKYKKRFLESGIELIVISEPDKGISDAFNKGIKKATGDVIGIINSDDKLYSNAIEVLNEHYSEEIDVYYAQCVIFNDLNSEQFLALPKTDLSILNKAMSIYHPSAFVSKNAYRKYGGFNTKLKYCMDRELFLRFKKRGALFKYIAEPMAYYREGGVNQKQYKKNLIEGAKISVHYGMSKERAYVQVVYKYIRYLAWRGIQKLGLEHLIHKRVK